MLGRKRWTFQNFYPTHLVIGMDFLSELIYLFEVKLLDWILLNSLGNFVKYRFILLSNHLIQLLIDCYVVSCFPFLHLIELLLFYWIYLPDTFQQVHRIWSISPPITSIIVSVLRLVKNQTIRRETQIFHPSHRHRLSPKLNWPFDWEFPKVFSI